MGGEPCAPLKSKTTHAEFYCNGKLTASYLDSLSGTMSAPLTADHGGGGLMSSVEDSRVKTSVQQEGERESPEQEVDYGETWRGLCLKCIPSMSSLKTVHCLWEEVLHWSSVTLPAWGMMRDGELWEHITLEPYTRETDAGSLPTPVKSDHNLRHRTKGWEGGDLVSQIALRFFDNQLIGLVAEPVEKLMGWPTGWTDLKPLGMDRFQSWQQSHGICLDQETQEERDHE